MNMELLPQYELLQHEWIEDVRSDGYLLHHKKSGARVLVLQNDDENKVFNIAFKTLPTDSTGVPHILEHSVLCGSRKFPMKDPFVELVKGSLNTFLNAMTYPDKTMFPIASCNDKDFCNLMDVYLDAVFYPNIYRNEQIFHQEGWSCQIEDPEDEIEINGVVYNEMKGAYSSPEDMLERQIVNSLFPDTVYGVDSGGDPQVIPTLEYEDFLAFHKKYYHPSNSYIYFYGNMDIEERLNWLDREYLCAFDLPEQENPVVTFQAPFEKMHRVSGTYPVSEEEPLEDNTYLTWNVVIGKGTDVELSNAFTVLEYALLSAPGARLKQALLDAGIGNDIMGDYGSGVIQPYLSITAKNANAEDEDRFLEVIRKTLEVIVKEGVDKKALYAGINSMEFKFREADYGSFPKGLIYGLDVFDSWLYDENAPFDYLKQLDVYATLRERVETSYYEDLIQKYLLDNPHASFVMLAPEPGLTEKTDVTLREKLCAYKASLSGEQIADRIEATRRLREFQETPSTPEELLKLPMLTREDIGKKAAGFANTEHDWDGLKVLQHDVFTNGISYLDLLFDAGAVPADDLGYLGILKSVLGMVDTEHFGYSDLNNDILMNTGGISAGISVFQAPVEDAQTSGIRAFVGIHANALYEKLPYALEMAEEILTSRFDDDKRLYEIIARMESRLSMQQASAGHQTASMRAMSYFSSFCAFNDTIGGIAFYALIADLEKHFDEKKDALKAKLRELMGLLFRRENLFVSVTADTEGLAALRTPLAAFVQSLPSAEDEAEAAEDEKACVTDMADGVEAVADMADDVAAESAKCEVNAMNKEASGETGAVMNGNRAMTGTGLALVLEKKNEGFTTPGQVQYVARAGNFKKAGFAYTGALNVLKVLMSYEYLWVNIRVKGGAYGAMCGFSRRGDSYLASYRDPNLRGTNEVFEGIPAYLEKFDADEREMTKYIIGAISEMDTPLTPAMKGSRSLNAYFAKLTNAQVQQERDEVLTVTSGRIRALAPLVQAVLDEDAICVVGNEQKIKEAGDLFYSVKPLSGAR